MEDAAALLIIGNEILSGKVRDTNSPFLLDELRALGLPVGRIVVLPDREEEIAATVRELAGAFSVVFSSGGVGPTHDDVTMAAVARAFGLPLEEHPELAQVIRAHFGPQVTPSHLKMALLPKTASLTWGEALAWPVVEVRNVLVLPGDPEILRKKFLGIRERFRRRPFHLRRIFTRQEEAELAPVLDRLLGRHPEVAFGSYPVYNNPEYKVQLTVEAKERVLVEQALGELRSELRPEGIVRID